MKIFVAENIEAEKFVGRKIVLVEKLSHRKISGQKIVRLKLFAVGKKIFFRLEIFFDQISFSGHMSSVKKKK